VNGPGRTARTTDDALEGVMSRILRIGVIAAASLVAAGGLVYLLRVGSQSPHYGSFSVAARSLRDPVTILRDAFRGQSTALIELGLIVLVLTPVARVVFALLAFLRLRDRLYVLFSAVVLTVLIFSLTGHSL
jgi:uncharacterized membrane protein